jgi:hypothetical protein
MKSADNIREAAGKLSDRFRKDHVTILWDRIIGMRNRLIHAYFDINRDILRQTVVEDLPSLVRQLEAARPVEQAGSAGGYCCRPSSFSPKTWPVKTYSLASGLFHASRGSSALRHSSDR